MDQHANSLPSLRDDLRFSPVTEAGGSWYVIEDPLRHLFYRVGAEEYRFMSLLRRHSSMETLLAELAETAGVELSVEQAGSILAWLAARQLLRTGDTDVLTRVLEREQEAGRLKRINRLNLITFKVPVFNPDPLLSSIGERLRGLTGGLFFCVWLITGLFALSVLHEHWALFINQSTGFFSPANLTWIWLIWFGLKLLHELFHALVCHRYGGRVYEAGLLFILFIPLTYVSATSSWNFPSKWQRIHVAVAGMFIELGVAFAAVLLWSRTMESTVGLIAHNTVIIAGVSSLLFNANPLMRFDGYYVLSDLLSIPNLYSRGLLSVRNALARFFLGTAPAAVTTDHRLFIGVYGIAIHCWRILVLVSLAWLASRMAGGFGIFITLGAIFVWIGLPLLRFFRGWPALRSRNPGVTARLALRLLLSVAGLAVLGATLGWQQHLQAPAVVEYASQIRVKNEAGGFVRRVAVQDGQEVQGGAVLLELDNEELVGLEKDLSLRLRRLDLLERLAHSQGRLTDRQILVRQRQTLAQELDNARADLAALTIRAPAGGQVIARNLDSLHGRFLPRGSELLWLVTPEQVHLKASVSQVDIDAFHAFGPDTVSIDLRSAGLGTISGRLRLIEPTASAELIHPALGAVYGGPLDVRQTAVGSSDDMEQRYQIELFEPRFSVHIELPDDARGRVRAGQTATITIPGPRVSLARILQQRFRGWLQDTGSPVDT